MLHNFNIPLNTTASISKLLSRHQYLHDHHHHFFRSQIVGGNNSLAVRASDAGLDVRHSPCLCVTLDQQLCNILPTAQQCNLQCCAPVCILCFKVSPRLNEQCRDLCWGVLVVTCTPQETQQRAR